MATPWCSSNWWHCPLYLAMSITLAAIAISAAGRSSKPNPTSSVSLSLNATLAALRIHGFNSTATLLQLYPHLSSPQTTLFAIQDNSLLLLNSNPQFLKQLLKYHSLPLQIPFSYLNRTPRGTCFKTLARGGKRIGITNSGRGGGKIEINNVSISHPDLFVSGTVSIHGVTGPFAPLGPRGEITEPPFCRLATGIKNLSQWTKAFRFLSSNGYVPFGIGLNSALEEGVIREYPDMVSATVFAPLDFAFVSLSRGLLYRVVRYHIIPLRLSFADLSSLPDKSLLKTLIPGKNLVVSNISADNKDQKLGVNGVEIIAPNALLSQHLAIHGISRALTMEELPDTSL